MHNPNVAGRRRFMAVPELAKALIDRFVEHQNETNQTPKVQTTEPKEEAGQGQGRGLGTVNGQKIYPTGVCPSCEKYIGKGIVKHYTKCQLTNKSRTG